MTGQPMTLVKGNAVVTPSGSDDVPMAATRGASIGETRFRLVEGSRSGTEEDGPRSLNPYWEITEYTTEEFNAFLEADRLTPELAERYKDLLED